jgi:hypothetical protein
MSQKVNRGSLFRGQVGDEAANAQLAERLHDSCMLQARAKQKQAFFLDECDTLWGCVRYFAPKHAEFATIQKSNFTCTASSAIRLFALGEEKNTMSGPQPNPVIQKRQVVYASAPQHPAPAPASAPAQTWQAQPVHHSIYYDGSVPANPYAAQAKQKIYVAPSAEHKPGKAPKQKQAQHLRQAGTKVWHDTTLDDWPEGENSLFFFVLLSFLLH